jgi:serine/threonine protein kinase
MSAVSQAMASSKSRSGRTPPTIVRQTGKRGSSQPVNTRVPQARSGPEREFTERQEIGAGGSSKVYRVFDSNLKRFVAMKVLAERPSDRPQRRARFIDEARTTAQLDHPNIVPVHDLVVQEGKATHFVMKLVRGRTLETVVEEQTVQSAGPERLHRLILTFLKVCEALAFAHSRGVIHCDLKPSNIMVGDFGEVYLMDWGIAHKTHPDPSNGGAARPGVRGTPPFMSPEQAQKNAAAVTEKTDIFGLGAVLYYILTGKAPFPGKTATQSMALARTCDYQDIEIAAGGPVPPALGRIVKTAMASDPSGRYGSVSEMIQKVEEAVRGDWHLPIKTYPAGAVIVQEGEFADAAYIVVSGTCRVLKNLGGENRLLRVLGPGDVFGETGILSGDVRTATVEAIDEVVLRVVTREMFQNQLGVDSWLAKFVLTLANRFRDLDQKLAGKLGDPSKPS